MNRRDMLGAALLLLLLSGGCASGYGGLPRVSNSGDHSYRLAAGDEVRIDVFGFASMANTYLVGDAGTISLPILSTVRAEGQSASELEVTITDLLRARDIAPNARVSVQVQKYRPFFILGQVQKPGQYAYVPGMSVLTAVSIAGGYTFRAQTHHAVITRPAVNRTTKKGRATPDTIVMPGDTIMVPEAWF